MIISLLLFLSLNINAASIPDEVLHQEGRLFTVQLSKGEPVKIFVVGKEAIQFDPATLQLTVRQLAPGNSKVLGFTRENDYFVLKDKIKVNQPVQLEVKTKLNNKEEVFKFKIYNRMQ